MPDLVRLAQGYEHNMTAAASSADAAAAGRETVVDPEEAARVDEQARLAEALVALIRRHAYPGFGGVRLHDADGGITVWWEGPVPVPVREFVRNWPVTVEFRTAVATESKFEAALGRVASAAPSFPFKLRQLGMSANRDTIELHVDKHDLVEAQSFVSTDSTGLFRSVDIPVRVVEDSSSLILPAAVFDDIRMVRERSPTGYGFQPQTLRQALPTNRYWFNARDGRRTFQFSHAVLIGSVTSVEPGPAYRHGDDDTVIPVDFDDPRAVERAVDVHIEVDHFISSSGPTDHQEAAQFRWGGLGSMNEVERRDYMASLRALGRVVVVVGVRHDPDGDAYIPIMQGASLGQVDALGKVRFPGLGEDETAFVGDVVSVAAITRITAQGPLTSEWPI